MFIFGKAALQRIALFAILFLGCYSHTNAAGTSSNLTEFHILGVNDFHGQLTRVSMNHNQLVGSAPYLAAHLKQRKAKNPEHTFLVHAGDMVGASSLISAYLQDEPTIEMMNAIGFDIGVPGNHEFDEGAAEMLRLIHGGTHPKTGFFGGATFPYIAANVVYKKTNQPLLPPSIIKEVDGIKIAFIGVVTKDTPLTSAPGSVKDLIFIDEAEAINKEVEHVKQQGVNAIVVIAHEGGLVSSDSSRLYGRIVEIAEALPSEVGIIIAGHTHLLNNQEVNGKLIVQSKCYGTTFEDVTFTIDRETGRIVSKHAELIPTYHEGVTADTEVEHIVSAAKERVAPIVNEVVGHTTSEIQVDHNEVGESPLGELLADAARKKMGTDFSFVNPFGVRANIPRGDVTVGTLYDIQPHGNSLIKMTLTGEQVRRLLNQQFKNSYRPQFLQPSGLTFSYSLNRPESDWIINLKTNNGTPLVDSKRYSVTVNEFLAAGGDGFSVLKEGVDREERMMDVEALIAYVKELPNPFSFQVDGRIQKMVE